MSAIDHLDIRYDTNQHSKTLSHMYKVATFVFVLCGSCIRHMLRSAQLENSQIAIHSSVFVVKICRAN